MTESAPVELAVVILAKNEARHIGECIATLGFADRVVVSDSYSDDGTVEIARAPARRCSSGRSTTSRANATPRWRRSTRTWIFFVDADERITSELAAEVRQVIAERSEAGWWVPRHNFIAGHEVRHGGFYPDYQLRLLRRARARYDPERPVHEVVLLDGESGYLQQPMIHYNYASWAQFHWKQRRYAQFEGRILAERGVKPWPHKFIRQPLREFWRRYVTLQGYKDGWIGLKLGVLLGFYYGFMPHWYLLRQT